MDCFPCIRLRPPIALYDVNPNASGEGFITRIIRKYYAPNLLHREVKQLVLILFGGLFVTALVGIQRITLGLGKTRRNAVVLELTPARSTAGAPIRFLPRRLFRCRR